MLLVSGSFSMLKKCGSTRFTLTSIKRKVVFRKAAKKSENQEAALVCCAESLRLREWGGCLYVENCSSE